MARVAIVSYDIQTVRGKAGGVGAFCTRWARLLRAAGEDVTLVLTRTDWEPMAVDPAWKARYQAEGIHLMEMQAPPPQPTRWPEVAAMRMAEMVTPVLRGFDIVYFQDWGNTAFDLVRKRRYSEDKGPVCVTVLHGPSEWELSSNEQFPALPDDLHLAYVERYAARHSDYVVSPSAYMVRHLTELGWEFPAEPQVLGLPMPRPAARAPNETPQIERVVYFGRAEVRKGLALFTKAMELVAKTTTARPEVVLLGSAREEVLLERCRRALKASGYRVSHESERTSEQALEFLRERAAETLCVVPSPADNFPYAVVEASLVAGMNLVACCGGGVPEILGQAEAQLAEPYAKELAAKIAERMASPLRAEELAQYDCEAANARWMAFHQAALQNRATAVAAAHGREAKPSVDVITTYFQKAKYLPQFVEALEHQTTDAFSVVAVDDGSPDAESRRVFDEVAAKTAGRGWTFFRQENLFVDRARNNAAARSKAEYLLFVDSDDVPAPNAVERMRDAIERSGDDALICASYLFASEKLPIDLTSGEVTCPAFAQCIPLGINLVGGLLDPSSFGGSMFLVRRSAFEAVGGFTAQRGAGHEDWELYVRPVLAGFKVDVLPEMLQFYRQVEGSLARTLGSEASLQRLIRVYEETLRRVGLGGAARSLVGLHRQSKAMRVELQELEAKTKAPGAGYAYFTAKSGRFVGEGQAPAVDRLRGWYREHVSMETRLKFHRIFLQPFFGPYEPPR